MKVLLTGSAGFVGRHFDQLLTGAGHDVVRIDIADPVRPVEARDFFRRSRQVFDLVIHLAAVVGGRETIEGEPLSVAVDLAIDADMFAWALRTKPGHVVYFSSSAAYPVALQRRGLTVPLEEDDIDLDAVASPDLTYGWSKLTGEYLAQYVRAEGVPVTVFRPFSGYGTDQNLAYPFPAFIDRAARGLDPFEIWGDGTQVRDFIHIDDITQAVMAAVRNGIEGPINLGTGIGTSFNQLAEMVTRAAGYSPEIKHLEAKPTGVHHRVAEPARMLSFYRPRIWLGEGIEHALKARR